MLHVKSFTTTLQSIRRIKFVIVRFSFNRSSSTMISRKLSFKSLFKTLSRSTYRSRFNSKNQTYEFDNEFVTKNDQYRNEDYFWEQLKRRDDCHDDSLNEHRVVMKKNVSYIQTLIFIDNDDKWCTSWLEHNSTNFSNLIDVVWTHCISKIKWHRDRDSNIDDISKKHEVRKINEQRLLSMRWKTSLTKQKLYDVVSFFRTHVMLKIKTLIASYYHLISTNQSHELAAKLLHEHAFMCHNYENLNVDVASYNDWNLELT